MNILAEDRARVSAGIASDPAAVRRDSVDWHGEFACSREQWGQRTAENQARKTRDTHNSDFPDTRISSSPTSHLPRLRDTEA